MSMCPGSAGITTPMRPMMTIATDSTQRTVVI